MARALSTADTPAGRSALGQRGWVVAMALAAILSLALYLRWDRLEWVEFDKDQAWSINRAYEFVQLGDLPLEGIPSSLGPAQGPVEIWLLALPVAISQAPRVATGFVGLLQVLAVLATYLLASRWFGRTVGLLAALLYACNPWAVYYARKIWTPDLTPAFVILFFACLYASVTGRRYLFAAACATLALLVLLHPSAGVYVPLLAVVWLVYRQRLGWRPLLAGAALAALVVAPYLYGQARVGFAGVARLVEAAAGGTPLVDLEGLVRVLDLAAGDGLRTWLAERFLAGPVVPAIPPLSVLTTALVGAGLVVACWRLLRTRGQASAGREPYFLLVLWFAAPVLLTLRHSLPLQHHYYIVTWPLQFILIALALTRVGQWARRGLARLGAGRAWLADAGVGVVVLALVCSQLSVSFAYLGAVAGLPREPLGVPLTYMQQATENLRAVQAELRPAQVLTCCSTNQTQGLSYLARPDLRLVALTAPERRLWPSDLGGGAVFLVAHNDGYDPPLSFSTVDDEGPLIRELTTLGFRELPERAVVAEGRVLYRLFQLPPDPQGRILPAYSNPPGQVALLDGRRLAGYQLPASVAHGEALRVSVLWQTTRAWRTPGDAEENLFAHLVDGSGAVLAQRDWEIEALPPAGNAGDYLLSEYELPLPDDLGPGIFQLELGAYNRYTRQQTRWQGATGAQGGDVLAAGTVKLAPASPAAAPQRRAELRWSDGLQLRGYDLHAGVNAPDSLAVTLHWSALTPPADAYVVSVQLLDEGGRLIAQHDGQPVGGNYPTSYWAVGEGIQDRHTLAWQTALPDGDYRLMVVVYAQQTQARLRVGGEDAALLLTLPAAGGRLVGVDSATR